MTQEEAIKILEALKDHINDDGKRELSVVQKAILDWIIPPPQEEKATVEISNISEPKKEVIVAKAKAKAKPKSKKKK